MNYQDNSLKSLKLGQKTEYASQYDRTLLQPVPRALNRDGLGITQNQPFTIGADIWTAYEISWLNEKRLTASGYRRHLSGLSKPKFD